VQGAAGLWSRARVQGSFVIQIGETKLLNSVRWGGGGGVSLAISIALFQDREGERVVLTTIDKNQKTLHILVRWLLGKDEAWGY
jgi:hypothetical protein